MKVLLRTSYVLLLMLTLLLTSCSSGNEDTPKEESEETSTIVDDELPAGDGQVQEAIMEEKDAENEAPPVEEDQEEPEGEGEVEASLLDRALLASMEFAWPDSYKMVSKESNNDEETMVTIYQKGYSKREERTTDGITSITIYNVDEGITYEYIDGESEGTLWKDTESDLEYLEEDQDMLGRSLLSILEEDLEEDIGLEAKRVRWLGRKAVEIKIIDLNPEEDVESTPWTMVIDAEYTVGLKSEVSFGEEYFYHMEAIEVEFDKRMDDSLFEPPKNVNFAEY